MQISSYCILTSDPLLPGSSFEALKYFQKLYAIEKEAKENSLSFEERYQLRNNKAPPILYKFKNWLEKRAKNTSEQAKLGKAISIV